MPSKRFLIAPLRGGYQTDVRPWLIPDDAFAQLNNMYVFRGRIRKRFGSELIRDESTAYPDDTAQLGSRLRINIGTTNAITGNFTSATPCVTGGLFKKGQLFSIGETIFTVIDDTAGAQATLTTGSATATFDTSTGDFVVTGNNENPSTTVYFYPAEPVMGIMQNESASINDEPTYAFDTRFAYQYTNGAWERLGSSPGVWTGNNDDFFWGTSWRGSAADDTIFFVSNFNFGNDTSDSDALKYWDGANWNDYTPQFNSTATNLILTARIILPFKDRLILLNVVENTGGGVGANAQYGNRCRFSQNGSPVDAANSFLEDVGGRGGYIDAPTQEQILSAEFLKDRLIVFFEQSTWELVYTGNEIIPFRWQKINTELGVESTFSIVPFDQIVMGVGNVGIHACSGASVERIDSKIPDYVFEFSNENEGVKRVQGVRDYFVEQVYWTFPSGGDPDIIFPNKVLIYDYKTGTWATNDDSITAFGYFQNQNDRTWESSQEEWQEADFPWSSASLIAKQKRVLAGNQQGFLFIIDPDDSRNAPALQITDITGSNNDILTVIDHNLEAEDYIAIEHVDGVTYSNTICRVLSVTDSDTIVIDQTGTGTYTGQGTIARVSQPAILTKQYNFFNEVGMNISVNKVDFLVDKTVNGEFTSQSFASSSDVLLEEFMVETRPYNSSYYPLEQSQSRLWHSIYPNLNGEVVQFNFTFSDSQMRDSDIAWSDFQMHALLFHVSSTSSRFE